MGIWSYEYLHELVIMSILVFLRMSLLKRPAARKRPAAALEHDACDLENYSPYCLINRPSLPKLVPSAPDFLGIEYSVVRRKRARQRESAFAKPLRLIPKPRHETSDDEYSGATESWDLHVWLNKKHCYYHRLVGLTLNQVCWGANEKRLGQPYTAPLEEWGQYVVHHLDWNPLNVSQTNLAPMLKVHHDSLCDKQVLRGQLLPKPRRQ